MENKAYQRHKRFNLQTHMVEKSDTDRRISKKLTCIREFMEPGEYMAWYVTTSFRDDVLEKEINEKYAEVTQAWLELIKEQEASRIASEPQTAEGAASAMLIGAPSLKDMSLADQKDWFAGVLERRF